MTKQAQKVIFKKTEVNLNYLRKDLDIWHRRVVSWLDNEKTNPPKDKIKTFGIEVVQKLCIRKILKKKDIDEMKFPELPLTPKRSCSASPNRHTTPGSASRRSKSITRVSPKDQHNDCQKRLDFNDEEDGYKVDADINPATCTCAHSDTYYKCRISLLEKQNIKLEKELQNRNRDVCPDCNRKEQHMQRYKAERNELKEDRQEFEKMLTNLAGERNDLAQKLQKIEHENAKLVERNKNFETHILKAEQDETLCLKTRSYVNTIQNQKKLILEIQKRNEEQKIALKDANDALEQQIQMLERCREEKNDAESMLSDYLIKNDSVKLQCEIAQLQKNLNKQKQKADQQIQNLKKDLKEKENELQQGTKRFNELNEKLKEMERQGKDFSSSLSRDRNELLEVQKNNRKLQKDNESLEDKIYEIEKNHAEEKKQHIDIETKFQHQISNLKIQNSRADKKVAHAERKLEEITSKCKEQQSLFNSKRCQLEREIKKLILELDEMRKSTEYRWSRSAKRHVYELEDEGFTDVNMLKRGTSSLQENYSSVGGRSDTEKENISLRSEITELLKNIEKMRQEYNDLSEKYETGKIATKRTIESLQQENNCLEQEKVNFRAKFDQIQSDLNRYKNEQVHQQDSSHETIENLLQQNSKLDKDRGLLRDKIFSLENEKIKLEDLLNKSKDDHKKLQRDQDILHDNLREKSNELIDSEARIRKLEADILFLENTKTENEQLKESLREIEGVKSEFDILEKRYQKETSDRMSSDNISTKYKDDNDRLRKERNSARIELQKLLREKKESYQNLNTEQVLVREELQKKEREKSELVGLFKDKEEKNLQQIKLYEKDIDTLKSRCREDNDKMRQSEHEIETLKSRCRDDKDKIQRLEHEIETLKSSGRDENNKMRQMEREIENLKSRLTGEKANQYSAYEMLQNKNDLEACRHQKKALEDERNELQKENNELENELQSLNSKLEQFKDSARNISNLKKEIKDHEEGYRNVISKLHEAERQMREQNETIEEQKQENREMYKEKKDLENKLTGLALNNEEQDTLGKECEDLKIILQEKQKELNNLKSRFQELADSKETSEVLNKIIENLQQEKSDLNQRLQELEVLRRQVHKLDSENLELKKRLEIRTNEKSSILKENKELKNILQEKLSEVKRLETRLQQYAEKSEDIPALKRHLDKLQSDNDQLNHKLKEYAAELEGIPSLKRRIENLQTDNAELEKRGKHKDGLLQKSESTVQKMQKDNQKLQTEIISQKQNYDSLNNKLESLKDKNLELDDRLRRRSPVVVADPKNCQNCWKYRNDISDLKREINDLRDRLSEAAGNKLRDNNPNIADLSDMNRPTSLAEKFSSLYTDEYTDAMEVIEDDMDEAASVKVMLDWLKRCYEWCQRLAQEQRETLINRSIGFMEDHGGQKVQLSDRCLIFVKEFQKKIAVESLVVVGQICHVKSVTQQTLSSENYIVKYIKKCSELCWMMQISDPPLYLNFDVNSGENLNKNDYNVFTKSGSKIDYLVWPVLYLHKTGPMLAKGVAQGK